ncbi:hypothetical protein GEMRC1_007888 [Eukaryota sp. GEM-RC1]
MLPNFLNQFSHRLKPITTYVSEKTQHFRSTTSTAVTPSSETKISPVMPWEHPDPEISSQIEERVILLAQDLDTAKIPHSLEESCKIDVGSNAPLLIALLEHIPALRNLRLWFVPSKISEEVFWKRILFKIYDIRDDVLKSIPVSSSKSMPSDSQESQDSMLEELETALGLDSLTEMNSDPEVDADLEREIERALAEESPV